MSVAAVDQALVSREERHRRGLLLGVGALLLLSVGPVFGHHFATGLEHALRGRDHLGVVCLIALHEMLRPLHLGFHALVLAGLLYAAVDRLRAWSRVRRTLAHLETTGPAEGDPFASAAAAIGLSPSRIRVVQGLPNPAFTVGWLRPRVYVASGLVEQLSAEELEALLAHESAHVMRRDPLRLSLLRFLALVLFWVPALRRLADDVADEAEIQADDHAAGTRPLALATALLAHAGWRDGDPALDGAVGFAQRRGLLARRIRRLAGEDAPAETRITRRAIVGAFLALALVWVSGAIVIHPLPFDGAAHHLLHCDHPHRLSVTHLFCKLQGAAPAGSTCPHTTRAF